MLIVTYTYGEKTLIGVNNFKKKTTVQEIDSRFLYANPDIFKDRFLSVLSNLFDIKSLNKEYSLLFIINGNVSRGEGKVIESNVLNNLSFTKLYDGFSFQKVFRGMLEKDKIVLINDFEAMSISLRIDQLKEQATPTLFIQIQDEVEVSIVKDKHITNFNSAIGPIKRLNDKDANFLLCDVGIHNMLWENDPNILEKYTQTLIDVLEDIVQKANEGGINFKSIFIYTNKKELILYNLLSEHFYNLDVSIFDGIGWFQSLVRLDSILKNPANRSNLNQFLRHLSIPAVALGSIIGIPMLGTLGLPAIAVGISKILSNPIEDIFYYSSAGVRIAKFQDSYEFRLHWKENKDVGSKESYYLVQYKDKTKVKVFLRSLKSISDLQQYKF